MGYNTDGEGFIESLLTPEPGASECFIPSLKNLNVLLLGAGGSARAVAFHLSDHLDNGKLIIANRTLEHAQSLCDEIRAGGRQAVSIDEGGITQWASQVALIVNSTTKGQGGIRRLPNGRVTLLEPYSALAPAHPPSVHANDGEADARWQVAASTDIALNNRSAEAIVPLIPQATGFYDLIYHPEETVFLRQGRTTGHRTMNGASMIVCQAVIAFCKRICHDQLVALGKDNNETFHQVRDIMYRAW